MERESEQAKRAWIKRVGLGGEGLRRTGARAITSCIDGPVRLVGESSAEAGGLRCATFPPVEVWYNFMDMSIIFSPIMGRVFVSLQFLPVMGRTVGRMLMEALHSDHMSFDPRRRNAVGGPADSALLRSISKSSLAVLET